MEASEPPTALQGAAICQGVDFMSLHFGRIVLGQLFTLNYMYVDQSCMYPKTTGYYMPIMVKNLGSHRS
jgi:hypothetical protein